MSEEQAAARGAGALTERLLDVLVRAPLGLLCSVRDQAPSVVKVLAARGRHELRSWGSSTGEPHDRARATGERVLGDTAPRLRDVAGAGLARAREYADHVLTVVGASSGPERGVAADPPGESDRSVSASGPQGSVQQPAASTASDGLAIPGYDQLSASQVVERLDGLSKAELEAIREHEVAHRSRNTVLGKIRQLTR